MDYFDYLIAGGGLTASSCASTLRGLGAEGRIGLLCAEPHLPYHRPPLSKGVLLGREPVAGVYDHNERFYQKKGIEVFPGRRAASLDAGNATIRDDVGGSCRYGKLLIATGSALRTLNVPGGDLGNLFYLRTVSDAEAILAACDHARTAVVVGAGFIGMELASAFAQRGLETHMLVREDRLFTKLQSRELADFFTSYYREQDVTLHVGQSAEAFEGTDRVSSVLTTGGERIPCDLVAVGVGVEPDTSWLQGSGAELGDGVVVNEFLESNLPNVYAAGDVANFYDPVFNKRRRIEHWDNAIRQGELAARNMLGRHEPYRMVSYFFSDLFDLNFEFLGDNSEFDQVVTRGRLEERSAVVLWLKDHQLVAAFLLGESAADRPEIERIILAKADLSAYRGRLEDAAFPLAQVA